ncbi:MAG: hypothetical protein ORO03_07595 [Alphaproteobacteria bacterium]|nr:hypothetical protein [Alphaproteobacteria bacterium]
MDAFEIAMVIFMVALVLFTFHVRHHSENNPRFKKPKPSQSMGKK